MSVLHDQGGTAIGTANPLPVTGQGQARTSNPSAVGNGANIPQTLTSVGVQVVKQFSIPELDWQYAAPSGGLLTASSTAIKAAAGTGIRNYLTGATVINVGATPTEFAILDGATVIWRTFLPANMSTPIDLTFITPIKTTANAAMNIQVITASTVYFNAQGYAAP